MEPVEETLDPETPVSRENDELIKGLRELADFLESRPNFPSLCASAYAVTARTITAHVYDKEALGAFARSMGTCKKVFDNYYLRLVRPFGPNLKLEVTIDRAKVCKQITTWDCSGTDESLLAMVKEAENAPIK